MALTGRTALVTGGSRGIGLAIVRALLAEGVNTVLTSTTASGAAGAVAGLAAEFPQERVLGLALDVRKLADVEAAVASAVDRFGSLDVLINNAGASWGAKLGEFPEVGWDKVMDTNVKGVFFLTQALLPQLEAAASPDDPARVINIGSVDGIRTPTFDTFSYGPSKAAVHALTRQMAAHLVRRNILVNAIAPGPFPTWMLSTGIGTGGDVEGTDWDALGRTMGRGRVGNAQDAAGLAIFLSSRASAFIVGEVIACDGGILVSG